MLDVRRLSRHSLGEGGFNVHPPPMHSMTGFGRGTATTDDFIAKIDEIYKEKEKEILEF